MRLRILTSAAFTLIAARTLHAQQAPDLTPYLIADRNAEIALARSAAPGNVSDSATVLVLERKGFVQAAHGTNGFTCLVLRSFTAPTSDPTFWNPKVVAPSCFNAPAARTVLAPMLKRVDWVIAGVTLAEVDARTERGYASHTFPTPATGAMAYMTSPRQHLVDANPHWLPHLMFFYDRATPASAFGAAGMDAPVINGTAGDAHAPVLALYIPVRQWSDGSPAPAAANH